MTDTVTAHATPGIALHDRRVRVFVSSTLGELASEREAARAAITRLRLTPVMFELGARPHPPRERDRPKLMYIKTPAPQREPRLTALIERIWAESGVSTTPYRDPAHLEQLLADDLAVLLTERFDATAKPSTQGLEPAPLPMPPTPIIGREREAESVLALLRD